VVGAAAVAAIAVGAAITTAAPPRTSAPAAPGWRTLDAALAAIGFGLDEVTVVGHRMADDRDVLACLAPAGVRSMAVLDGAATRRCMEAHPWIAAAALTRIYPGRLTVTVTERRPFAVWHDGGRTVLVDADGRVLAPVRADMRADLPQIEGAGAPAAAPALLTLLATVPPTLPGDARLALVRAVRVDGRRWRVMFERDVVVELPADGERAALAALFAHEASRRRIDEGGVTVDLRPRFEIAVRPTGGA
jgi:cell division protein FtsQ